MFCYEFDRCYYVLDFCQVQLDKRLWKVLLYIWWCCLLFCGIGLGFWNFSTHTAWTKEIAPRGGYPLGLIEYIIERVDQFFFIWHFLKSALIQRGAHPSLFINLQVCWGALPSLFINLQDFRRCPPLTFMKSKGWAPPENLLNYTHLAVFGISINPKGCPPLTFHQPPGF